MVIAFISSVFFLTLGLTSFFPTSEGASIYECKTNGQHFVIATSDAIPFMIVKRNGPNISHVDGFVHQIVSWMAQKCNFTFEYVLSPDEAYGSFENGTWNGMVGMLVRKEVKMIAADLTNTYPRSLVVQFTIPFSYDPMMFLIPYPELDSTISGIVKPYQYQIWIGIIISLFVGSIFLGLISYVELRTFTRSRHQHFEWIPNFWFLFRVVANPDSDRKFSLSMRWIVAVWCLTGIVIVNAYTSSLVSYLMAPRFVPLINTVQDLADSDKLQIVVVKSTAQVSALMDATSGPLAKLGAFLRSHPENILSSYERIEDKVYYGQLANPLEESTIKSIIYNDFKRTGKCRLFMAKEPFYPNQCAFATAKSDPMAKLLSDELLQLSQMGLLDRWIASFSPPPYRCSVPLYSARRGKNQKLTLNYLSSAFLLYGVGVVTSVVAFSLERLFSWWRKSRIKVKVRPARAYHSTYQHRQIIESSVGIIDVK